MASLFTTRFAELTDGSSRCPLYVIVDAGSRLFTNACTQKVFDRLRAPPKEMIVFNFNDHMLTVTHPEEVCQKLANRILASVN